MFINQVFKDRHSGNEYNMDTMVTPEESRELCFEEGYIYKTTSYSDDYILDSRLRTFNLKEIASFFVPFELKIDDLSKQILSNKEKDLIRIIPIFQNPNGSVIMYNIKVHAITLDGKESVVNINCFSIYEGLVDAYRELRKNTRYYPRLCQYVNFHKIRENMLKYER